MEDVQDLILIKSILSAQYNIHHSTIEVIAGSQLLMENCYELENAAE